MFKKFTTEFFVLDARERNHSIEGLRGIAVLMVFNVHFLGQFYKSYFSLENSFVYGIFETLHAGHFGVDIFFLLSGFLIWRMLFVAKKDYVNFIIDRCNRLLPSFFLNTLVLSFASFSIGKFVSNVLFIPSFNSKETFYNYVSWTLGWEWLFYSVVFGFALIFRRNKFISLGFLVLTIICMFVVTYFVNTGHYLVPDPYRFSGFVLGCLCAEFYPLLRSTSGRIAGYLSIPVLVATCFAWGRFDVAIFANKTYFGLMFVIVDICVFFLISFLMNYSSIYRRILEMRILRIFGQISYSMYLVHACISIPISMTLFHVDSTLTMVVSYLLSLLITFLISSFFFYLSERQYLKRKRGQDQLSARLVSA